MPHSRLLSLPVSAMCMVLSRVSPCQPNLLDEVHDRVEVLSCLAGVSAQRCFHAFQHDLSFALINIAF